MKEDTTPWPPVSGGPIIPGYGSGRGNGGVGGAKNSRVTGGCRQRRLYLATYNGRTLRLDRHLTELEPLMNPQKEIPVLDDEGFFLGESNAILQYICDMYKPTSDLYPQDPKLRAIVNHRLCFNLSTYYANISAYSMAPIFFDYERTDLGLKKVTIALEVFETYFEKLGTSHVTSDHLMIADFPLFNSTMTLEAINFDFSKYTKINNWYNNFKKHYPELWKISEDAMKEIQYFAENPPDLSHLNHPIHPIRKINK